MSLLFETIRVAGRRLCHLEYHNARLNSSRLELFGAGDFIDLGKEVAIPVGLGAGEFRCRVTYGERIDGVTFTPYVRKTVRSLTLVDAAGLGYAHKYADRSGIGLLLAGVKTDDILIVRDELVTDTSYANIAFFDGGKWLTPASPLLRGTTRARLLDEGRIHPEEIRTADLGRFSTAVLMNAMLGFDLDHRIPTGEIRPL
ncbi:MAG TPA: aminotransferase class IV [Bacteroidota bacterium]|nr:aminotransferase class IV [Bacteroidota bacterium]